VTTALHVLEGEGLVAAPERHRDNEQAGAGGRLRRVLRHARNRISQTAFKEILVSGNRSGFSGLAAEEMNMARYYFNIRHGNTVLDDPDGTELPSLDHALVEAEDGLRELVSSALLARTLAPDAMEIVSEDGSFLSQVTLRDTLGDLTRRS
jgi:hypothetical protein